MSRSTPEEEIQGTKEGTTKDRLGDLPKSASARIPAFLLSSCATRTIIGRTHHFEMEVVQGADKSCEQDE